MSMWFLGHWNLNQRHLVGMTISHYSQPPLVWHPRLFTGRHTSGTVHRRGGPQADGARVQGVPADKSSDISTPWRHWFCIRDCDALARHMRLIRRLNGRASFAVLGG